MAGIAGFSDQAVAEVPGGGIRIGRVDFNADAAASESLRCKKRRSDAQERVEHRDRFGRLIQVMRQTVQLDAAFGQLDRKRARMMIALRF